MSDSPPLRPVPDPDTPAASEAIPHGDRASSAKPEPGAPRSSGETPHWVPVALSGALLLALILLAWSRAQLGGQISELEARNTALVEQLAERDRVIGAHERRLDDVRAGVEGIRQLLDAPLD